MTVKIDNLYELTEEIQEKFIEQDSLEIFEETLMDSWQGVVSDTFKLGRYKFNKGAVIDVKVVYLNSWSSGLELWRDGKRLFTNYVDYAELNNLINI